MTHTIKKSTHRITTPTELYEANYRRFIRLSTQLSRLPVGKQQILAASGVCLEVLEQFKYTSIISLKQSLFRAFAEYELPSLPLSCITMELRVCHDACVIEVISYEGTYAIQSARVYPNQHMWQIDEKRQLNFFLKELLEEALNAEKSLPCQVRVS